MTKNTHPLPILAAVDSSASYIEGGMPIDLLKVRDDSIEMQTLFIRVAKSAIRTALRDQECDIIPRLEGLTLDAEMNRWGDNLQFEVTYCKRGWRATYGGHFDKNTKQFVWSCYAN